MLCRQVGPEGADCNRPAGDAEAGRELHISGYPDGARLLHLQHNSCRAHFFDSYGVNHSICLQVFDYS